MYNQQFQQFQQYVNEDLIDTNRSWSNKHRGMLYIQQPSYNGKLTNYNLMEHWLEYHGIYTTNCIWFVVWKRVLRSKWLVGWSSMTAPGLEKTMIGLTKTTDIDDWLADQRLINRLTIESKENGDLHSPNGALISLIWCFTMLWCFTMGK